MFLRKLNEKDEQNFINLITEQVVVGGSVKGVRLEDGYDFTNYLKKLKEYENISFISYDQASFPTHQYVLCEDLSGKILALVVIRPYLTKELFENFEGNVGYYVPQSERGKGYAKASLKLAIDEYKKLNPTSTELILCCYKENIPSRKVIENCGGVLIEEISGILTPQKYKIKI